MSDQPLAAAISRVARVLSPPAIAALTRALDATHQPDADARRRVRSAVPVGAFAAEADRLLDAWASAPSERDGSAIALAVRAAADATKTTRDEQRVDLVWTGPTTTAVPVRLTQSVLLEVISSAERELVLVSYAAFRVPDVLDALAHAAARGVDIKLVLETTEDSAGKLTIDAAHAFGRVREHVGFYVWPAEQRPPVAGGATLHAKTAVADDHTALITSANLTEHAIRANMELGVLIHGGPIPQRLSNHIAELIHQRTLVRATDP